jgi:hypothetical protein
MPPSKLRIDANGRECSKCQEYKTWDEYSIKNNDASGHRPTCKTCEALKRFSQRINQNKADGNALVCPLCKGHFHHLLKHFELTHYGTKNDLSELTGGSLVSSKIASHMKMIARRQFSEIENKANITKSGPNSYFLTWPKKIWPEEAKWVRFKLDKKLLMVELVPCIKPMADTRAIITRYNRRVTHLPIIISELLLEFEVPITLERARVFINLPDQPTLELFETWINRAIKIPSDLVTYRYGGISLLAHRWPKNKEYCQLEYIESRKFKNLYLSPVSRPASDVVAFRYGRYKLRKAGSRLRSQPWQFFRANPDIPIGYWYLKGVLPDGKFRFVYQD